MTDSPADLRDLYYGFGRAAELAQLLEVEAGNLALAFVSLAFDESTLRNEDKDLFRAIVEDVNKRTFGNLLKQICKIGEVSKEIETIINNALEKRNYLMHRFFRAHNLAIHSEEGRVAMREEVAEIYKALSLAHTVLSGMTHTFNAVWGRPNITEEQARTFLSEARRLEI